MNLIQGRSTWVNAVLQLSSLVALMGAVPAVSAATLNVQPQAGEPTAKVDLRGEGMAALETVDLRYDGTVLGVARANIQGAFQADDIAIPASALPGRRPITAVGRSSGTRVTVPFLVRTNWPQFHRGPFRHGEAPHENVLSPENVTQLQLLWNVPAGLYTYAAMQGSPVVVDGWVYIIISGRGQGRLLALDAATGARRWSRSTGYSDWCGATPAVARGQVYAPVGGRMVAHDARTGAVRWSASVGGWFPCAASLTPAVVDGRLFISPGAAVAAYNAASGKLLWRRSVCIGTPPRCEYATSSGPPAAGEGIVYVTNYAGGMAAYDAATGRQLWSRHVGSSIDSSPVVEGDVVYVGVLDGRLHALDRRTGAELWSAPTGYSNHSTPALANGLFYVGSDGEGLTAIDAKTGAVRWQQTAVGIVRTSPAVANGVVYLGAGDGRLYALDSQTGAVLYSRSVAPAGRLLSPSPVVADGVVYVGTGDRLLAFGLRSGAAATDR